MTRVEAAAADYLRYRDIKKQIANISDAELGSKFECSTRSITKVGGGHRVSILSDEDHRLIRALIAERNAMRAECRGMDLQSTCKTHHVGKTTLINHLIAIGQWEDAV